MDPSLKGQRSTLVEMEEESESSSNSWAITQLRTEESATPTASHPSPKVTMATVSECVSIHMHNLIKCMNSLSDEITRVCTHLQYPGKCDGPRKGMCLLRMIIRLLGNCIRKEKVLTLNSFKNNYPADATRLSCIKMLNSTRI